MTYQSEVLADSPVVYFRLGESSGTTMVDSSGNGRNGTYNGSPTLGVAGAISGDADTAATLSRASSQYGSFGTAGLPSGASPYTLSIWCKPSAIDDSQGLISIGNFGITNQSNALRLGGSAAAPTIVHYWWANDMSVSVSPSILAVGSWVHIAATWDGTYRRVYLNGDQVGVDKPVAPGVVLTTPRIGRTNTSEYFNGSLDEATVYNTALSRERVRALYALGAGITASEGYRGLVLNDNPIMYFRLGESSGAPVDSSGWRWTTTVNGSPARVAGLLSGDSNGAFDFDGATQYLDLNPPSLPALNPLTVTAVVRPDGVGKTQQIVARAQEASGDIQYRLLITSANLPQFVIKRGGTLYTVTATTAVAVGSSYHLAGVFDDVAGTIKVYVNGTLEGTTSGVTGSWGSLPGGLLAAGYNGSIYARFDGVIDEVAVFGTALSGSRISTYASTALGSPSWALDGVVAATSTTSGSATVAAAADGSVAATSAVDGAVNAALSGSGQVDAVSTVQGTLLSGIDYPVGGQVDAASAVDGAFGLAFTVDGQVDATSTVEGGATATVAMSGQVDAVSGVTGYFVGAALGGTEVRVGVKVEVGALTLLNLKALPGVEVEVGGTLEVGDSQSVVPLPGVTIPVGASVDGRPIDLLATDPRHKRAQWRYVITDLANNPLGELTDLQHDPVEDAIGEPATMQFTMPASGDQFALVKPIVTQCQVWDGNVLRLRGPILPGQPSDDGQTITYKVHDPSWFWRDGRRVITRIPQRNLLKNGDFRQGLTYWSRGYDKDSLPKAAPTVKVVTDDFAMDTDGLDPIRAAEIEGVESFTQSELSSNAVFYPNLATFRPGGKAAVEAVANAMPTTAGLKVSVVGHTANDGTGNGLGLSARRAEAAKAVILSKRPHAVVSTKGVGYYDPKPGFPIDSQEQRRVVIGYNQTISGKSLQWMRQTLEVTHPKSAKYGLELTASWMLKVADAWSVEDANMMSGRLVARRKSTPTKIYDESNASISDTDPVDRWIPQTTSVTIPADGRTYTVDLYLYAPAAVARYTAVGLWPEEKLFFWGADQATIFRGVMEHIQKPEYGYADLGVGVRAPATGVLRDREFAFRELIPADTALDGLTAISRGIEWDTITTATATTAAAFWPRQGKVVEYALVLGGNVAAASPANTRDVGSQVIAQAQDLGSYRAMAYASDRRAFGGTLIQRVVTAEQDTPLNELGAAAKAELFWSRSSTPAYWVDIDPDSIAEVLANTRKGDTVRLILDGAFGVDAQARIVRRQIHPDSLRLMLAFEEA